jgi:hypothetical protein
MKIRKDPYHIENFLSSPALFAVFMGRLSYSSAPCLKKIKEEVAFSMRMN